MVLMVKGSSARQAKGMETTPTDATIVGIVDTVEMGGTVTFKKY
jgi:ethanolamine utilization protein EutN